MWTAEIRRSLVKKSFFTNNGIFTAGKCHVINFSNGNVSVTIGEVDHVTLSSRENAVNCKKLIFHKWTTNFSRPHFQSGNFLIVRNFNSSPLTREHEIILNRFALFYIAKYFRIFKSNFACFQKNDQNSSRFSKIFSYTEIDWNISFLFISLSSCYMHNLIRN